MLARSTRDSQAPRSDQVDADLEAEVDLQVDVHRRGVDRAVRVLEDAPSEVRRGVVVPPVEADARHWLDLGATFVAVGSDLGILARETDALARKFKPK
jgi:2-dehydro-3-deoxyglucarate aldolase